MVNNFKFQIIFHLCGFDQWLKNIDCTIDNYRYYELSNNIDTFRRLSDSIDFFLYYSKYGRFLYH